MCDTHILKISSGLISSSAQVTLNSIQGLTLMSAFCSGATQGLLSIDTLSLQVKVKHGSTQEKEQAENILNVVEQHHLLLSTLLIGNALAVETLPIMLHHLMPDWMAVLISTSLILLFGEIIPSAFTTGPDQLYYAEQMIPYVKVLQAVLYIVCYPLSLLLDYLLGTNHDTHYAIKDIRGLLNLHTGKQGLDPEQLKILNSLQDLREQPVTKKAKDIKKVFMISASDKFNADLIRKIKIKGFSRIPIYENTKDKLIGTFSAKQLLRTGIQDYQRNISQVVQLQELLVVSKDTTMLEMIIIFQQKQRKLAFVTDRPKKVSAEPSINDFVYKNSVDIISVISLTDVFEEMLDLELYDEDVHGTLNHNQKRPKFTELQQIKEESLEKGLERPLLKQ